MTPRGSTPRSSKEHQVATILDPEEFAILERMSGTLRLSKAQVARQLIHQGILALKAAASAADDGRTDLDAAAIYAMQMSAVDAEVVKLHLDALGGHLDAVAERSWSDAALLAAGASEAIGKWAEQQADAHGTTVDQLMGLVVGGVS